MGTEMVSQIRSQSGCTCIAYQSMAARFQRNRPWKWVLSKLWRGGICYRMGWIWRSSYMVSPRRHMLLSDNSDIMSYFEWSERVRVMINEGTLGFEERQMSPLLAPGSAAITMIPKYTQWHKYNNTSKYFCICESECNFIFDRFIKLSSLPTQLRLGTNTIKT